jgi:serine/threonine protein kinase
VESADQPLAGTVIDGRYVIEEQLGEGGMGSVFAGTQIALSRRVAIKVLRAGFGHDSTQSERLIREAQALSTIRHPNVVEVIDFGKLEDESPYVVMEFLDGKDLAQILAQEGRMAWSRARGILLQVVAGLRAAHRKGVLHRDIKPSNCFLVQDPDAEPGDYVKLVDFGIAKFVCPTRDGERKLTAAAHVVGTARYLAPEVYDGADASVHSDIYAFGVLAYKLLTGKAPFEGRDNFDLMLKAKEEPPRPMREAAPDLMPSVERMVLRAMAKKPRDRFADTNALEAAILQIDAAGRRRASGRTGTVMPGSLGATNEQPILSREELGLAEAATLPLEPSIGHSQRTQSPWESSAPRSRKRSSSMATPIFVSVTIGALAGAAFLVYARFGQPGSRRDDAAAESEPDATEGRPDPELERELVDRVRRQCADMALSGTAVKVRINVAATGAIDRVEVAPSELQRCIEPLVREVKFGRAQARELSLTVPL